MPDSHGDESEAAERRGFKELIFLLPGNQKRGAIFRLGGQKVTAQERKCAFPQGNRAE